MRVRKLQNSIKIQYKQFWLPEKVYENLLKAEINSFVL